MLDPTGNVTALAGSWTSRSLVLAPAAAAAAAPELAVQRLGPNPIVHAHGACVAFNRQPIIWQHHALTAAASSTAAR